MSQPTMTKPKAIDAAFLSHVVRSSTQYSEGWRAVCARLLWAEKQRDELSAALRSLRNEAQAMLAVADPQVNGLSNIRALQQKIAQADHVLAHADAV